MAEFKTKTNFPASISSEISPTANFIHQENFIFKKYFTFLLDFAKKLLYIANVIFIQTTPNNADTLFPEHVNQMTNTPFNIACKAMCSNNNMMPIMMGMMMMCCMPERENVLE